MVSDAEPHDPQTAAAAQIRMAFTNTGIAAGARKKRAHPAGW
jgi:hypothetical protein